MLVGVVNTLTGLSWLFLLGTFVFPDLQLVSLTIANLIGVIQGHFLLRRFVWQSDSNYFQEFGIFIVGAIPTLIGSYFFFVFGTFLGLNFIWVQFTYSLVASIFAFIWNYRKTFRIVK